MNKKQHSGFSLIEIAIVLTIAGLPLSGLLPLVSAQRTNAAISATRSKGEAIVAEADGQNAEYWLKRMAGAKEWLTRALEAGDKHAIRMLQIIEGPR